MMAARPEKLCSTRKTETGFGSIQKSEIAAGKKEAEMRRQAANRKYGFTVVELLVVIAIIAVLAALLFPTLSAAKAKAQRTGCMNNLRQINLGVRMYTDDSNDSSPGATKANSVDVFSAYKGLLKGYVGLNGAASSRDKLFACPADTFYYDYAFTLQPRGYLPKSLCAQSNNDYSSYSFNAGNLNHVQFNGTNFVEPGIAGMKLSSIKHPARTVLVAEMPAFVPYSWHEPKRPFNQMNSVFNDSRNVVSFVDGHVSYLKMHWDRIWARGTLALAHDPPAEYDYQWSGD
jgi:prepilin-type N-terminal cleavage/methylation domain-containing protein